MRKLSVWILLVIMTISIAGCGLKDALVGTTWVYEGAYEADGTPASAMDIYAIIFEGMVYKFLPDNRLLATFNEKYNSEGSYEMLSANEVRLINGELTSITVIIDGNKMSYFDGTNTHVWVKS